MVSADKITEKFIQHQFVQQDLKDIHEFKKTILTRYVASSATAKAKTPETR